MQWRVFLDESGHFDNPADTICIAGVTFPDQFAPDERALRQQLQRTFSFVPWPLHTAHLNHPIFLAIAAWTSARKSGRPIHERFRRLRAHLDRANALDLRRVEAALSRGDVPPYKDLAKLQALVPTDDAPWVEGLQRQFLKRLRRLCAGLAQTTKGAVCLATERDLGALRQDSDGYRHLLSGLAQQLHSQLDADTLHFWVLERDVDQVRFNQGQLRTLLHDAVGAERAKAWGVHKYNQNTRPLLVLADFIANGCRYALRYSSKQELEAAILARTGFPLRVGERSLVFHVAQPVEVAQ